MPVRLSTSTYLTNTTGPSLSDFTIMGWYRALSIPADNQYSAVFTRGAIPVGGNAGMGLYLYKIVGQSVKWSLGDQASDNTSTVSPVANLWYHVCWSRAGNANDIVYINGVPIIGPVNLNEANVSTQLSLFGDPYSSVGAGDLSGVKIWTGVQLTLREILLEMRQLAPVRQANLWAFYPLLTADNMLRDWGPGRNTLTLSGTTYATYDAALVPWTAPRYWFVPFVVDAGGGAQTVTVTDAGTGSDAVSGVAVSLALADTAAGDDGFGGGATVSLATADTGTGLDVLAQLLVGLGLSDAGTGTDLVAQVAATLSAADAGSGTDLVGQVLALLAAQDVGVGSDAIGSLAAALGVPSDRSIYFGLALVAAEMARLLDVYADGADSMEHKQEAADALDAFRSLRSAALAELISKPGAAS
jgi:hypothetical protein